MTLDDRLRRHFDDERSTEISGGSADGVVGAAKRRTTRRRVGGAVGAAALIAGTAIGVVALRDGDPQVQVVATQPDTRMIP